MPLDRSYVETNRAARERLAALTKRLSDEDLSRSIGNGWTVSSVLAHIAFWDRRAVASFEMWEKEGVRIEPPDIDSINDSMLPEWLRMPDEKAVEEALAAAEAADATAARLAPDLLQEIMDVRPRAIIRATHRTEHLDEIERALSHPAP